MKARYWFCLPFYLVLLAVAWLGSPLLALAARRTPGPLNNGKAFGEGYRLPWWLGWFQTPDNSLDGDDGHKARCPYWQSYFGRVRWLFRNPGYGLAWGWPFAYLAPRGATYIRVDHVDGQSYRIWGSDGSYEVTTYGRWLKTRFGWILGDIELGRPALFLFSVRLKD